MPPPPAKMFYSVYFKLIYSETSVSIDLPEHIKINELRDYIKPHIEETYHGLSNFHILPTGTGLREQAPPILLDEDVELFARFPKYFTAFYISPILPAAPAQECEICMTAVEPLHMISMRCGHTCCDNCIYVWRSRGHNTCPFCRASVL